MRLAVSCCDDVIAYAVDSCRLLQVKLAKHDMLHYLMLAVGTCLRIEG
jgi:hypothetical protein